MKVLCALLFLGCACIPDANATDLITQPEPSIWIAPPNSTGQVTARLGDTSVPDPTWYIAQTNSSSPLPGNSSNYASSPGVNWSSLGGNERINFYSQPSSAAANQISAYQLSNNTGNSSCGVEVDLFAKSVPSSGFIDPNGNPLPSRFAASAPVNQLSAILLSGGLYTAYEQVLSGCGTNSVGYVYGISAVSSSGYRLDYRLLLRDTQGGTGNNAPCLGYPRSNAYCFATGVSQLGTGQANQSAGVRTFYNLNVLNNFKAAIAMTADANAADWHISGAYFGHYVVGQAIPTSSWDSFKISAY